VKAEVLADGQVVCLVVLELRRGQNRGGARRNVLGVEEQPSPQRIAAIDAEVEALEHLLLGRRLSLS
jgi:hypothetical protein